MLRENLDHEALTPKSMEWRDSLFALGLMLFREGLELEAKSRTVGVDSDNAELRKVGLKDLEAAASKLHEAILRLNEALHAIPTLLKPSKLVMPPPSRIDTQQNGRVRSSRPSPSRRLATHCIGRCTTN